MGSGLGLRENCTREACLETYMKYIELRACCVRASCVLRACGRIGLTRGPRPEERYHNLSSHIPVRGYYRIEISLSVL